MPRDPNGLDEYRICAFCEASALEVFSLVLTKPLSSKEVFFARKSRTSNVCVSMAVSRPDKVPGGVPGFRFQVPLPWLGRADDGYTTVT